jgi:hypothetical protein
MLKLKINIGNSSMTLCLPLLPLLTRNTSAGHITSNISCHSHMAHHIWLNPLSRLNPDWTTSSLTRDQCIPVLMSVTGRWLSIFRHPETSPFQSGLRSSSWPRPGALPAHLRDCTSLHQRHQLTWPFPYIMYLCIYMCHLFGSKRHFLERMMNWFIFH